jgi:hypothetical protein
MSKSDKKPRKARSFEPYLNPSEREELHGLLDFIGPTPPQFADSLRNLARNYIDDGEGTKLRAICLLFADCSPSAPMAQI